MLFHYFDVQSIYSGKLFVNRFSVILGSPFGVFELNLPGHAQGQSHLCHEEHDRGTSIADKRQCDTGIWHQIYYDCDVQDHLQCNMYKNAANDQRSKKIRCILRDKKQPV